MMSAAQTDLRVFGALIRDLPDWIQDLATTQAYLHPTKQDLAATLRTLDEAWGKG